MKKSIIAAIVLLAFLIGCGKGVTQDGITGTVVVVDTTTGDTTAYEDNTATEGCGAYNQKLNEYNAMIKELDAKKAEMAALLDNAESAGDNSASAVDSLVAEMNSLKQQMRLVDRQVESLKGNCG